VPKIVRFGEGFRKTRAKNMQLVPLFWTTRYIRSVLHETVSV